MSVLCQKIPDEALRRKEIIFLDRSIYTNRVWVKQLSHLIHVLPTLCPRDTPVVESTVIYFSVTGHCLTGFLPTAL